MSTTIDQRVVEMRFDNKHFESNVSNTMSTLDKLKQKLNLTGASKGLEDINSSVRKIDMSGLGRGVETVSAKFSALQVMGVTALANITNSAVNAGKRIASALTIDPVKTGFQEYETQINATQTILANTASKGSTIDDVNKALKELNDYADLTIYNFTEMTRNIGTFTAAGIDLDTSVNAIQGIANLAAVSGSTSQQASTAMYQLSQALASGTVKLMDWNSVVNAGMGGEMFQNALKETSRLLGTGAEAAIKARGSFRESLRDGWLTAEVLTETLKKFTTTGANEYVAEYIGESPEVVKAALDEAKAMYGEADAIEHASKALAEKSGKNQEEIKQALQFAKNAEDAATKVKTFTQLWDVLKESAQSGWSQTWKLIVGDFEQAKSLLTPLADFLTGVIGKFSDARNAILESALGKSFAKIGETIQTITKPIEKSAESIKSVVKTVEEYEKVVDEIIGGGIWGTGQERWNKLTEAGYDWAHAQNLVNEKLGSSVRHATDYKEAQNEVAEAQDKVTESTADYIASLVNKSDTELKRVYKLNDDQIAALRELQRQSEKTGIPVKDLVENIDLLNGRTLLINGFKNAGQGLLDVFNALKEAWQGVFPPSSTETKAQKLYDLIAAFHKFSTGLRLVDKETGEWTDTGNNLIRTLKGIFAVVDLVTTIVGGGFKIAFKLVTKVLSYFNMDILEFTAIIGDTLFKFNEWFDSLFDVSKILDKIVPALVAAGKAIKDWFSNLKETKGVQNLIDALNRLFSVFNNVEFSGLSGIGKVVVVAINKIIGAIKKLTGLDLKPIGEFSFAGLIEGFANGATKVVEFIAQAAADLINKFCDVLGIQSPSKVFMALGGFIIAGLLLGIKEGFISVPESLQGIADKCIEVFKNIDWGAVFAIGISIGALVFLKKIGDALSTLAAPFENLGLVFESTANLMNSFATNIKTKALKNLAIALAILAGTVILMVKLCGDDYTQVLKAVGIIALLAVVLGVLAFAMEKMSSASVDIGKNGAKLEGLKTGLLGIAAAIGILALVVKLVGSMDFWSAVGGFAGLIVMMGAMLGFMAVLKLIAKDGVPENIDKVANLMLKISFAMGLMVLVVKLAGTLSPDQIKKGAGFAAAFLAFTLILTEIGNCNGARLGNLGGLLVKVAIAMALMVGVCKLANLLEPSEALVGIAFALAFTLFVKILTKVTQIGNDKQIAKLGGLLLSISFSMMLMVGVCKLVGMLSIDDMKKGALFVGAFTLFVGALVLVTKTNNETQVAKVAGTIIAIAVAVGILAAVSMLLSLLKIESLAKGVTAVTILGTMMAIMIRQLKGAQSVTGSLVVMTVAIAVMAAAVAGLSLIDPGKLAVASGAISLMMGMFALMIKSLGAMNGVTKVMGPLIIMTVVVGLLAAILWGLSALDVKTSLTNATAISVLMLAMSGVLKILSTMNLNATQALKSIGLLTLMAVPMMAFVAVLHFMPDITKATENVKLLLGVMVAMTALLGVLALIGNFGLQGIIGIGLLTAMVIPMMAFVAVLHFMPDITKAAENVKLLIGVMTTMTVLLAALTIVGLLAIPALAGIVALTAMAIPMMAFVAILHFMPDITGATDSVVLLMGMMTVMTGLLTQLAKIGPMALIGVVALAALVPLITTIGVLVTAIGGLNELTGGGLEKLINSGIPLLIDLADGIGTMIGKFIGSIGEALGDSLVEIGEDISAFMCHIRVASINAANIDGSSFDGVKQLIEVLGGIGAVAVGTQFADMFVLGGTSMEKFEEEAKAFFKAIKNVAKEMEGASLPESVSMEGIQSLLDALKTVGKATMGMTLADIFTFGGTAMEKFQTDGVAFFKAIKAISREATGFTFPEDFSVKGLEKLLDMLKLVGNRMIGLAVADLFSLGGTAMDKFQADGVAFFKAVKAISGEATGFTFPEDFSVKDLEKMFEVMKTVGDYTIGASWGDIFTLGGTTMEKFQTDGTTFFSTIKTISTEASGIKTDAFSLAETAISKMKQVFESIKGIDYSGVATFTGIGTGGIGADGPMHKIGEAIKDYADTVSDIDTSVVSTSITAANRIKSLINSLVSLDTSGIEKFKPKSIGSAMKSYNGQVKDIDTSVITSSITSAKRLVSLINSLVNIDNSGVSLFNPKSIGEKMQGYSNAVADINPETISSSISAANRLKNFINSLAGLDTSGVGSFKSAIETLGTIQIGNLEKTFRGAVSKMSTIGGDLVNGIAKGMRSRQTTIITTSSVIVRLLVNNIRKAIPTFGTTGTALMAKFVSGIASQRSKVASAASSSLISAVSRMRGYYSSFYSVGSYLVDGFAAGISANTYKAAAKAKAMADAAEAAARKALLINSPSKVFREIGYSVPEGFAMGIDRLSGMVSDSAVSMGNVALDGLSNTISNIGNLINSDMDTQPTIRPVLDLSDVRSGAATVGALFSNGASVGVLANVNAISAGMNQTNQNGGFGDVVSAINKLRGDLGNVGGTSYNINGITYDDGTNVSDAVKSLVRAARIERRI